MPYGPSHGQKGKDDPLSLHCYSKNHSLVSIYTYKCTKAIWLDAPEAARAFELMPSVPPRFKNAGSRSIDSGTVMLYGGDFISRAFL